MNTSDEREGECESRKNREVADAAPLSLGHLPIAEAFSTNCGNQLKKQRKQDPP
jgi:hypothetical protein